MPRYKAKSGAKTKGRHGAGSPLAFLSGLGFGLCIAAAVFFYLRQAGVNTPPASLGANAAPKTEAAKPGLPQPTFDFYKILPNREVNLSEWVAEDKDTQGKPASDPGGLYILQVGSFKTVEAADQIKAKLALLGISADIQRVVINGQDVRHRVRIGPYHDPEKFEEVRQRLRANDMDFMVLKLKIQEGQKDKG